MQLPDYFQYKDIVLKLIADGDVDTTVKLINTAYSYQDKVKGESRTNSLHLKKRIKETLFYVAKNNKSIVGCVYLEPNGKSLHFGLLTVDDSHRGSSLAKAIMQAIQDYAAAKHYHSIALAYMSLAPWLKSYYERYGFIQTKEVTKWGPIDLVWMHKVLVND